MPLGVPEPFPQEARNPALLGVIFISISLFFGLPGCGKTTLMAMFAFKGIKRFKYVYSTVDLAIPGVIKVSPDQVGKFDISDGLLLVDEASTVFDNRAWKSFSSDMNDYFAMYRHHNMEIMLFTQNWDGVDLKIRRLTNRVYYCFKRPLLGRWITSYYRIPYDIIIPDRDSGSAKLGEIVQGYCKPNFLVRLFSHKIWRPKYYKFFDSWELHKILPPLPQGYDGYRPKQYIDDDIDHYLDLSS